jgi:hypothetical protein
LDTFNANSAVNTRYIIPIIFCLGVSLPPLIFYKSFAWIYILINYLLKN